MLEVLEHFLKQKFKDLTVHDGSIHSYLGMTRDFSVPQQVKIATKHFIKNLLQDAKVEGSLKIPVTDNLFVTRKSTFLDSKGQMEFHSLVAKLLYLAKRIRPGILIFLLLESKVLILMTLTNFNVF